MLQIYHFKPVNHVADISESRLQMAKSLGADAIVLVKTKDPQKVASQVNDSFLKIHTFSITSIVNVNLSLPYLTPHYTDPKKTANTTGVISILSVTKIYETMTVQLFMVSRTGTKTSRKSGPIHFCGIIFNFHWFLTIWAILLCLAANYLTHAHVTVYKLITDKICSSLDTL